MDKAVMNLRLQQWKPIFEAQAESGLNKEEWCKQNGIRRWEFYKRQRELRQSILDQASDDLLPENVTTDLIPSSETFVELPMKSEKAKHGAASVESATALSTPPDIPTITLATMLLPFFYRLI